MFVVRIRKKSIFIGLFSALICTFFAFLLKNSFYAGAQGDQNGFIKYAKFTPTYEVLEKAMFEDIKSHSEDRPISWIDILAVLAVKYGGDFKKYKINDMNEVVERLKEGECAEKIANGVKNFNYYKEVYGAVLCEFLGKYQVRKRAKDGDKNDEWQEVYGLKAFSPIAKTFPFAHYDDFGASRSYGYSRPHLGHDMMAAVGTPVIAVESGTVEIMGWNQYGGWRVGIRSFDKKRYYYYAHLRQNRPFHVDLKEGATVKAGDVIGYVGRTGYSTKENMNNIDKSHLHWGLELIFDESQKECDNEIWIDLYAITKLLEKNKSAVIRNNDTKEFYSEFEIKDSN